MIFSANTIINLVLSIASVPLSIFSAKYANNIGSEIGAKTDWRFIVSGELFFAVARVFLVGALILADGFSVSLVLRVMVNGVVYSMFLASLFHFVGFDKILKRFVNHRGKK